jgi:phosphatidylglycerol:prolipoprotein diacylglycerol transferase
VRAYQIIGVSAWLVALAVTAGVLRRRGASRRWAFGLPALVLLGCWVGAKLQYRLEYLDVGDALAMAPADLATPGFRLPLALGFGTALAFAVCRLARSSWPVTADALAMGAATVIAISRIGCFVNGCCTGRVCVAAWPWCVQYPAASEAYGLQLASHLIEVGTPLSLAVHPLPLYMSVAGILLLVAMALVLRHGAMPGAAALIFGIGYPMLSFLLEPMRATTPHGPTGATLWVSAAMLAVAVIAALRRWLAPRQAMSSAAALTDLAAR